MTLSVLFQVSRKAQTRALARSLAERVEPSDLIILEGSLGAGKTFFAQALCTSLHSATEIRVTSPTYTLVHEYETVPPVCHADVYRLGSELELLELGLLARRDTGWVLLVEWGTPYVSLLGGDALTVRLGFQPRTLQLAADGPRSARLLEALTAELGRVFAVG